MVRRPLIFDVGGNLLGQHPEIFREPWWFEKCRTKKIFNLERRPYRALHEPLPTSEPASPAALVQIPSGGGRQFS